jgi:hypothetical protein
LANACDEKLHIAIGQLLAKLLCLRRLQGALGQNDEIDSSDLALRNLDERKNVPNLQALRRTKLEETVALLRRVVISVGDTGMKSVASARNGQGTSNIEIRVRSGSGRSLGVGRETCQRTPTSDLVVAT